MAESQLQGALGRLSVVVEAYPELKANETMENLQEELTSTENRVSFARQAFNDSVTTYNTYKQTFPPVFFPTCLISLMESCWNSLTVKPFRKRPRSLSDEFFAHQEKARKRTGLLVMLFFLAVVAISVILSLIVGAVSLHYSENYVDEAQLLQYSLLCFAGVSLVVFCAMLIRLSELARSGGTAIATKLGGRLVSSNSQDPKQRQLLNVVEEMAIASGMPVPPVYLLENEPGINAFAAGMGVDDAVVGITQGALDAFNRDELQGVIAHEFSHILNGDMRINTRLMAYLFGIMFLGQIGAFVLEMSSSSSRRSRSSDSKGAAAIMLIGLAFLIVGWIGTFFGSMIKAAISRQREFLADASAVQFTRNDQGILGALLKIGASASKSLLYSNSAKEASHMMFGQCQAVGLNNLFATHPPLEARIRRIQPGRDGTFGAGTAHANHSTVSSFGGATRSFAGSSYVPLDSVIEGAMPPTQIGTYGERVISQIPIELAALARDPFSARFIPILLIFDGSEAQREIITEYLGSAAQEKRIAGSTLQCPLKPGWHCLSWRRLL